jgi:hypothetical protein
MSIFRTYSPQTLWGATLNLVNTLFHTPPTLPPRPSSYFTATLKAHKWIRNDLQGIFDEVIDEPINATIEKIHKSLQELETILFNSEYSVPVTIEGCQKYTEQLISRLKHTHTCVIG